MATDDQQPSSQDLAALQLVTRQQDRQPSMYLAEKVVRSSVLPLLADDVPWTRWEQWGWIQRANGFFQVTPKGRDAYLAWSQTPLDWDQAYQTLVEHGYDPASLPPYRRAGEAGIDGATVWADDIYPHRPEGWHAPYSQGWDRQNACIVGIGKIVHLFVDDEHALLETDEGAFMIVDLWSFAPRVLREQGMTMGFLAEGHQVRYGDDGLSGPIMDYRCRHWMVLEPIAPPA